MAWRAWFQAIESWRLHGVFNESALLDVSQCCTEIADFPFSTLATEARGNKKSGGYPSDGLARQNIEIS
jgi:hypothetical protein